VILSQELGDLRLEGRLESPDGTWFLPLVVGGAVPYARAEKPGHVSVESVVPEAGGATVLRLLAATTLPVEIRASHGPLPADLWIRAVPGGTHARSRSIPVLRPWPAPETVLELSPDTSWTVRVGIGRTIAPELGRGWWEGRTERLVIPLRPLVSVSGTASVPAELAGEVLVVLAMSGRTVVTPVGEDGRFRISDALGGEAAIGLTARGCALMADTIDVEEAPGSTGSPTSARSWPEAAISTA
jgi:hypothetical protein